MLFAATVLIGSGNVAQITALDALGPFTIVALRSLVAIVVLLPFAVIELRGPASWTPGMLPCLSVAATYFAASIVAQQIGAMTTTATNIGFLINMSAVFVPMLLWFTIRERPPLLAWPTAVIAVVGAYLVTGAGAVSATVGDALCLLAGLMDGVWIIALAVIVPQCRAPACMVFILYATTGLLSLPFALTETVAEGAILAAAPEILWLGGMTSAFGFLLSTKAQSVLSPCVVAVIFCFEAIVSAVLGRLFLGEMITLVGFVGAVLIILAVLMSQMPLPRWLQRQDDLEMRTTW